MSRKRQYTLVVLLVLAMAVAGYAFSRSLWKVKPAAPVYGDFQPYTITQKVERIYDNGSAQLVQTLEIFTAPDGGLREIQTWYNDKGEPYSNTKEQIIRPGVGSYFVNHGAKLVTQWLENSPPVQHLDDGLLREQAEFKGTRWLTNVGTEPILVYVLKNEEAQAERWLAPEFGMVPLGLRLRDEAAKATLVRTTLSIGPGDALNAYRWFNDYKVEKELIKRE